MTLVEFIKLVVRNLRLMVLMGLLVGGLVFFLTRGQKKTYTSKMVINTGVVSGYNIENHNSDSKVDRDYTRNELENLISLATAYETIEELSLRLLTRYLMLEEPDPRWILKENYADLRENLPPAIWEIELDTSFKDNVEQLRAIRDEDKKNPVFKVIYSDHDFFGHEKLSTIRVRRNGNSDLLEVTYTTTDPAVCQQTLAMMAEVFTEKHLFLKERQSADVLSFFEKATRASANRLRAAEDRLLNFRIENNIINYYEQTRFIADKKEDLDEMFFKEVMELEAAQASLKRLDEQLRNRGKLAQLNQLLVERRQEISEITDRLARYQIQTVEAEKVDPNTIQSWENQLQAIKDEINDFAKEAYFFEQTPEGVAKGDLLSEWLKNVIKLEEAGSRLEVLRQRKREFEEIYKQFAPWGSRLKKIEREIALAEDSYLANLHSYNQARLHLQNTVMSANLNLMDAPFYPTRDSGSMQLILTIVGFLAGFMLTLGVVVILEFLDQTLKRPQEAARKLKLPLFGVFPLFPSGKKLGSARLDYAAIRKRSVDLALQNLALATRKVSDRPRMVLAASTRGGEGVSFLTSLIVQRLRSQSKSVRYFYSHGNDASGRAPVVPHRDNREVAWQETGANMSPVLDQIKAELERNEWDYLFLEIPPLLSGRYPLEMTEQADIAMLICRANRTWNSADGKALETLREALGKAPGLIINATPPESIDGFLGELPRSRSRLRMFLKRLATFNFSGSSKI